MSKRIFIPWKDLKTPLPSENEMIDWAKAHRMVYHREKKKWIDWCIIHMVRVPKRRLKRIWLRITYCERSFDRKDQRARDPDNICSFKKVLLDALVSAEVIPDDSHKHIAGFTENFILAPDEPGVIVIIVDMDKEVVEDDEKGTRDRHNEGRGRVRRR